MIRDRAVTVGTRLAATFVFLFLAVPLIVVVGASLNPKNFLAFPPSGVSFRWYAAVVSDSAWMQSFALSLWLTAVATPVAMVLGSLAGYAMARWQYPGKSLLTLFILSPLMIAEVVMGLAFLNYLAAFKLVNTSTGLLLAYVLLGIPYVARTVSASVENLDRDLEVAAESLGASRARQIVTVVLPGILPGVFAGACFVAVLAFGELAITIFVAGPQTTTLALRIYSNVQYSADPSVAAAATIVIVISIVVVAMLERFIGLSRLQESL